MRVPRALEALSGLAAIARASATVDLAQTYRKLAAQRQLAYLNWVNVGVVGAPSFANGWSQFVADSTTPPGGAPGSSYDPYPFEARAPVGFKRDSYGFVHLRGCLQHAVMAAGVPMFAVPAVLVPSETKRFQTVYSTRIGSARWDTVAWVAVLTSGDVLVDRFVDWSGTGPGFFSDGTCRMITLDSFSYRAANAGLYG